jgi:hypothetical protein
MHNENEAPYQKHGILRYETLFGEMTPVVDVSHHIRDIKVPSHKDLTFFQLDKVLSPGSVFLGFGKPNVYLGMPNDNGEFSKLDAKSVKRGKAQVVHMRNFAQSGLIFLLHIDDIEDDHSPEFIKNTLRNMVQEESGLRHWTCVNANAKVLDKTGFYFPNEKLLSEFYFPMTFARKLLKNGIFYRNKRVKVTVIRTVPVYLENFGLSVVKSQWTSIYRHAVRYANKHAKWLVNAISYGKDKSLDLMGDFKKLKMPIEDKVTFMPKSYSASCKYPMTISYPSKNGTFFRWIWGPHSFFTITPNDNPIGEYLPEKITAYETKSGSVFNFIKQNILFNNGVSSFIVKHLAKNESPVFMPTESELFNLLRTHNEKNPNKYNIVVTGTNIRVMKLGIKYKFVDWVMSKHILSSKNIENKGKNLKEPDVRFAGEVWKTSDSLIHISNDSGTFAPTNEMLDELIKYFQLIFTETKFKKESAY